MVNNQGGEITPNRRIGLILTEFEQKLVDAGLDEEMAESLVDDLEAELDALEEKNGGSEEADSNDAEY